MEARFGEGALDERDDVGAVVEGGVFGEEAGAGGGDVGVSDVGEDEGGGGGGGVRDDAYAEFVGAAFEADCVAHGCGCPESAAEDGCLARGGKLWVVDVMDAYVDLNLYFEACDGGCRSRTLKCLI